MEILYFILVGAISGWLAGQIMKGGGFGLLWNIVLGIVGGIFGGFVLGLLGISFGGLIGQIATSVIGAILLIFIVSAIRKR